MERRRPTTDMTVEEVLARWPGLARVFVRRRMGCVGCAMARFDRLADAARVYGVPPAALVAALRRAARAADRRP
jgi:hybrid cluster-associated redox disulfide protein